jgi:NAD(P)-dependent dehydrogenase (short-subunit alcohol dehydrogenase family)
MAREVASRGVTVNVIAPGLIATDMASALGEDKVEAIASQIPAGRLGNADEVAGSIVFLASEPAAYITGAILAIDGGMGMGL